MGQTRQNAVSFFRLQQEVGQEVVGRFGRQVTVLFGDGAGAVVLEVSDEPGLMATHIHANGEYEDLLARAARTAEPARRFEIMKRAEALLMDAQPILPMTWYSLNYLHRPEVKGWHPLLLANHPWKHIHFAD